MKKRNLLIMSILALGLSALPFYSHNNEIKAINVDKKQKDTTVYCSDSDYDYTKTSYTNDSKGRHWDEENKILYYDLSTDAQTVPNNLITYAPPSNYRCEVKLPADSTIYFYSRYAGRVDDRFSLTFNGTDQTFFYGEGDLTIAGFAHLQVYMSGTSQSSSFIRCEGTLTFSDDDYIIENAGIDDTCKQFFIAPNIVVNGSINLKTCSGGTVFNSDNVILNSSLHCTAAVDGSVPVEITDYSSNFRFFKSSMKPFRVEVEGTPSTVSYCDSFADAINLIDYDETAPKKTHIRCNTTSGFQTSECKGTFDATYLIGDPSLRCDVSVEYGTGIVPASNNVEEGKSLFDLTNCDFEICQRKDPYWRNYVTLDKNFYTDASFTFIKSTGSCNVIVKDFILSSSNEYPLLFNTSADTSLSLENVDISGIACNGGQYGLVSSCKDISLYDVKLRGCQFLVDSFEIATTCKLFGNDQVTLKGGIIYFSTNLFS
ncbi:MAG: hypothetical protein HUJ61_06180, partial [Bacilli bacterium]|nr:hypothetical protein [Bacilli bacterium]